VKTFPIKKRISTELSIDEKQGLYIHKGDKERIKKKCLTDLLKEGKAEMAGMKNRQPIGMTYIT